MAFRKSQIFCILAIQLVGFPIYGQSVEKLSGSINTSIYDEITPVLSLDGLTLYFTRVGAPDFVRELNVNGENVFSDPGEGEKKLQKAFSQLAGTEVQNVITSEYNQEVWIAKSEKSFFDKVEHPGAPLNNALPNSICSATPEPNRFIINNQFPPEGGMKQGFSEIYGRARWSLVETRTCFY